MNMEKVPPKLDEVDDVESVESDIGYRFIKVMKVPNSFMDTPDKQPNRGQILPNQ